MSLKCSVFGHRFRDAEVTREREEQGSEVVTTITETETCERCGETRVVSENTEVTTLETPSDIVEADIEDGDGSDQAADEAPTGPAEESGASDTTGVIDEAEDRESASVGPDTTEAGGVSGPAPGGEDDAVILDESDDADDGDDSAERSPGEWPQADEENEGDDEWVPDLETTSGEAGVGPGELPSIESEQPSVEPTGEAVTVPEGTFHCPECGFTTDVESSSLRRGDFCPECHRGALEHRSGE